MENTEKIGEKFGKTWNDTAISSEEIK